MIRVPVDRGGTGRGWRRGLSPIPGVIDARCRCPKQRIRQRKSCLRKIIVGRFFPTPFSPRCGIAGGQAEKRAVWRRAVIAPGSHGARRDRQGGYVRARGDQPGGTFSIWLGRRAKSEKRSSATEPWK